MSKMIRLVFFIFLTSRINGQSLYSPNSDVVELNLENFAEKVEKSSRIWVVEFYAIWCGHCQAFAPEFAKAASALKGFINVGSVNVDQNKPLAVQFKVNGFPAIKIFGADKNNPDDYSGERTANGIVGAAFTVARRTAELQLTGHTRSVPSVFVTLNDVNFNEMVLGSESMWMILFITRWCDLCNDILPDWKQASLDLQDKVKVGIFDATTQRRIPNDYNISEFPTMIYFLRGPKSRLSAQTYKNDLRNIDAVVEWAENIFRDTTPPPDFNQLTGFLELQATCEHTLLCVLVFVPHILDCQAKCRKEYLNIVMEVADKFKLMNWGWIWSEAHAQKGLEEMLELSGYPSLVVCNFNKFKKSNFRGSFTVDAIDEFLRHISYGKGRTSPLRALNPEIRNIPAWNGRDADPVKTEVDFSDIVESNEEL